MQSVGQRQYQVASDIARHVQENTGTRLLPEGTIPSRVAAGLGLVAHSTTQTKRSNPNDSHWETRELLSMRHLATGSLSGYIIRQGESPSYEIGYFTTKPGMDIWNLEASTSKLSSI